MYFLLMWPFHKKTLVKIPTKLAYSCFSYFLHASYFQYFSLTLCCCHCRCFCVVLVQNYLELREVSIIVSTSYIEAIFIIFCCDFPFLPLCRLLCTTLYMKIYRGKNEQFVDKDDKILYWNCKRDKCKDFCE